MTTNANLFKLIIIKLEKLSYNEQIDIDVKDPNFKFAHFRLNDIFFDKKIV